MEVPIPNSIPNKPLPVFALALLLSPLTHLIFLFLSPIFFQVFSFTMWLDKLYDTLATCHRVFPEESPLFRKPCLIPTEGKMVEKGVGREWDDAKLKQPTKIWELKQISVHKNRQLQLYPIHIEYTHGFLCPGIPLPMSISVLNFFYY